MTWTFIYVGAGVLVLFLTFIAGSMRGQAYAYKSVVTDFQDILHKCRGLLRQNKLSVLDQFLHDLIEDTPYQPNAYLVARDVVQSDVSGSINVGHTTSKQEN